MVWPPPAAECLLLLFGECMMKIRDEVTIDESADKIWEYVGSPETWPLFHVKAGECRHVSGQADAIGALYEMEFRLGSKASMTRCEIVECRTGRLIALRSTLPTTDRKSGRRISARLTYEMEDLGRQTRVREEIDFDSSLIPLVFRPLFWLILRFGKPRGETTLMRLKRIIEEEG